MRSLLRRLGPLRSGASAEDDAVDVYTVGGVVRGVRRGSGLFFGGIPYAEAPVGDRRFAAPVARRPWAGVLDATAPAKGAPQHPSPLARLIGITSTDQSEDCLHVDVWTETCTPPEPLPVMVWIHGGGFEAGSTSNPLADGGALAARGRVVVVSIGYRLGVLGFLSLEGRPDNRALLDLSLGLEWVRDNIGFFGGDPDEVTLFGSSAGGTCVAALVAARGQSGLFRRAVVQSGSAEAVASPEEVRVMRRELFVRLGTRRVIPEGAAAILERVPIDHLLLAQRRAIDYVHAQGVLVPLQLVLDEVTLPERPLTTIHAGRARGIELLVGTNRDELRLWSLSPTAPRIDGLDALVRCTSVLLGPGSDRHASEIAEAYTRGAASPAAIADAFYRLATDVCFRMPALRLLLAQSRHARVFSYLFDWATPVMGGKLGAPHAIEIPFLFGTHTTPRMTFLLGASEAMTALSSRVQDVWSSFARAGDPSVPGFHWPSFDAARRTTVTIADELRTVDPAFSEEMRTLAPVFRDLYPVDGFDGGAERTRPTRAPGATGIPPALSLSESLLSTVTIPS